MKKTLCLLLALSMVFALCACGSGPSENPNASVTPSIGAPEQGPQPDMGASSKDPVTDPGATALQPPEKLTIGVGSILGRFLAGLSPSESQIACDAVFDTVFRWDPVNKKVISNILESWEWEDETTFIMHMRDDVYFSNGDNATAEDIVYSYKSHPERGSNYVNAANLILDECVALDDYTARFKLEQPYPSFPFLRVYLIDKSWSESLPEGWNDEAWYRPVGSGPYECTEWVNDSHMVLKSRGDDYWYKDDGAIVIDELLIKCYPDMSTLYMALETGEIDLAASVSASDYGHFLKSGDTNIDLLTTYTGSIFYFCFGLTDTEAWSNPLVREAIAIGVKWEEVGQAAWGDFYYPATSISSRISPDYVDIPAYEFDPDRAKELLAEAGYGPDNPLKLETTTMNTSVYTNSHEVFEFYASQLGIEAITHHTDTSSAIGVWIAPTGTDFAFWSMYGGAPGGALDTALGFDVDGDMGVSFTHIPDEHFIELYRTIKSSSDDAARSAASKELQQYAHDGFWRIPVSEETVCYGWRVDKLTADQIRAIGIGQNHMLISRLAMANFWE